MQAVVEIQGKQYRIEKGRTITVTHVKANEGDSVKFDRVLLISDENGLTVGKPTIENANVEARVLSQRKDKKIVVFKKKRRKGYSRTYGHRTWLTDLEITDLNVG